MKTFLSFVLIFTINSMNSQNMMIIQPDFLQKGDTILIVAPAGIVKEPEAVQKAKLTFENWGYTVLLGKHLFNNDHHFAGTDQERLQDMQWALDHPKAKAIWCARGGYGSVRIIDDLDFTKFVKHPKWMIGYSDFTVFHNKLHNLGFQTLHAPMSINFKEPWLKIKESMIALDKTLKGELLLYQITHNKYNQIGSSSGVLVGGNLTILENMLGTDTDILTQNKILFIEEIGEHKYHIDRLLRALDRKGYFKECKALIVGDFTRIKKNVPSFGKTIENIILAIVKPYNIPVLFDFPAGHKDKNMPIFLGKKVKVNITDTLSTIKFLD